MYVFIAHYVVETPDCDVTAHHFWWS